MELDLALEATQWTGSPSEIEALLTEETWTQRLAQWISVIRADLALICPQPVRQAEGISLSLRFIDDAEICKLNQSWRQKAEPTDVLSFAALEDTVHEGRMPWIEGEPVELGDIVVSIETAWRQAIEQDHALDQELAWLVSHGLLHLLGWDHPDEHCLNRMLCQQDTLLRMVELKNPGNVCLQGERPLESERKPDANRHSTPTTC